LKSERVEMVECSVTWDRVSGYVSLRS
jgi:hypothetical protein